MAGKVFLLAQAESLDDGTVAVDVALLQVSEQCAALADESGEGAFCTVVLTVALHVLREVADAVGEQCDLALSAAGVGACLAVLVEDLCLLCCV